MSDTSFYCTCEVGVHGVEGGEGEGGEGSGAGGLADDGTVTRHYLHISSVSPSEGVQDVLLCVHHSQVQQGRASQSDVLCTSSNEGTSGCDVEGHSWCRNCVETFDIM